MRKIIISILAFLIVATPFYISYAYTTGGGLVPECNTGPLNQAGEYENPCDFNQLIVLTNTIIDFLLFYVASPIAAIIFCYAGFKLLTSGGNEEAKTGAVKMMMTMVKGYLIALAAWLIVHTIVKEFGFTGNTFLKG